MDKQSQKSYRLIIRCIKKELIETPETIDDFVKMHKELTKVLEEHNQPLKYEK